MSSKYFEGFILILGPQNFGCQSRFMKEFGSLNVLEILKMEFIDIINFKISDEMTSKYFWYKLDSIYKIPYDSSCMKITPFEF